MPFAYMVRCEDGSYYSGSAVDLHGRVAVHNAGKGAKYTRARLPVTLAYWEEFPTLALAMKREAALKKLNHAEKAALAESVPPAILYDGSGE